MRASHRKYSVQRTLRSRSLTPRLVDRVQDLHPRAPSKSGPPPPQAASAADADLKLVKALATVCKVPPRRIWPQYSAVCGAIVLALTSGRRGVRGDGDAR